MFMRLLLSSTLLLQITTVLAADLPKDKTKMYIRKDQSSIKISTTLHTVNLDDKIKLIAEIGSDIRGGIIFSKKENSFIVPGIINATPTKDTQVQLAKNLKVQEWFGEKKYPNAEKKVRILVSKKGDSCIFNATFKHTIQSKVYNDEKWTIPFTCPTNLTKQYH